MSFFDDPPIHDFPDRAIRLALGHPHNLRDLVHEAAPELAARLDFDRMQTVPRDFLLQDWRGRESDLLFLIPFRGEGREAPVLVCLLLEHQSAADPRMPLRMLLYAVLYWERQWKQYEDSHSEGESLRLTPILPIVFHTGQRPWGSSRTLADLMDVPDELRPYVPEWRLLFWDLAQRSPQQLLDAQRPFMQLMAIVRGEREPADSFQALFQRAVRQLEGLAVQDKMRWSDLLWFALSWAGQRRPEEERAALLGEAIASQSNVALGREMTTMSQNVGLTWEGRGRLLGELATLREMLRTFLSDQFGTLPDSLIQQIESCTDVARLKAAVHKAPRLQSLDQLQL
jgi:hypothetical protein